MINNELSKLLQEHEMIDKADLDQLIERVNSMVTKKTQQVRRIRRIVLIAWGLFICLELFGRYIWASQGQDVTHYILSCVAWLLLLISVILTISWYVRSVDLRFERVQAALSTIQEALDALVKKSTKNP